MKRICMVLCAWGLFLLPIHAAAQDKLVVFLEAAAVGREPWEPDAEIGEIGFFAEGALPESVHPWALKKIRDAYSGERGFVQCWSRVAEA